MALFANLFRKKRVAEVVSASNPIELLPPELKEEFRASGIPVNDLETREDWILLLNCFFFGSSRHDYRPLPELLHEYDEFQRQRSMDSQQSMEDSSLDSSTASNTSSGSFRRQTSTSSRKGDHDRRSPPLSRIAESTLEVQTPEKSGSTELDSSRGTKRLSQGPDTPWAKDAGAPNRASKGIMPGNVHESATLAPISAHSSKTRKRLSSGSSNSPPGPGTLASNAESFSPPPLLRGVSTPTDTRPSDSLDSQLRSSSANSVHISKPMSPSPSKKKSGSRLRMSGQVSSSSLIESKLGGDPVTPTMFPVPYEPSVSESEGVNDHTPRSSDSTMTTSVLSQSGHGTQDTASETSATQRGKATNSSAAMAGKSAQDGKRESTPAEPLGSNLAASAPVASSSGTTSSSMDRLGSSTSTSIPIPVPTSSPKSAPTLEGGLASTTEISSPVPERLHPQASSLGNPLTTPSSPVLDRPSSRHHNQPRRRSSSRSLADSSISGAGDEDELSSSGPTRGRTAAPRSASSSLRHRSRSPSPMAYQTEGRLLSNASSRTPAPIVEDYFTTEDPTIHYKLLQKLGKGSFGNVYIGRMRKDKSGKLFAVKKATIDSKRKMYTICREIGNLRLADHPNVVKFVGSYYYKDTAWIIMEYCDAGTLRDLRYSTTLKEEHVAYIMKELLHGLAYMHSNGMMHRDIKGENVLLSAAGEVKIADLGLAVPAQENQRRIAGSKYWMAPEMILAQGYGPKADIYSLACTAYEMADGLPPYAQYPAIKALFYAAKHGFPPLDSPKAWSNDFIDFISICSHPNPRDRPSCADMLTHPFLKKACSKNSFSKIIASAFSINDLGAAFDL